MKLNILFVCTGNICRSPMAESVFRFKCRALGLDANFYIDSAGTGVIQGGRRPDPLAQKISKKFGILLSGWSREFLLKDFEHFNHIFAMDELNMSTLRSMSDSKQLSKVQLLRSYDNFRDRGLDLPDPYRRGEKAMMEAFVIIERCCDNILKCFSQGGY